MTRAELRTWCERLAAAWEAGDAEAAAALFGPDVSYAEAPFAPPLRGREAVRAYWREMLAGMTEVRAELEPLALDGARATVAWRARYRAPDGAAREVAGVSVGDFVAGRPVAWREWWHAREVPREAEDGSPQAATRGSSA